MKFRIHFRAAAAGAGTAACRHSDSNRRGGWPACRQPPQAASDRTGSRRGPAVPAGEPAVPAAAAGRPCRQPPRAGPPAAAMGRRVPARARVTIQVGCKLRSQDAQVTVTASRCQSCWTRLAGKRAAADPASQLEPSCQRNLEVGLGVAWPGARPGGRGGTVTGPVSWDYAFSPIRGTCGRLRIRVRASESESVSDSESESAAGPAAAISKLGTTYSTYENQHLLRLLTLLINYL